MSDKKEESAVLFLVLDMIENDAGESPYCKFSEYWKDHKSTWAQVFEADFYYELTEALSKKYDLGY